VTDCRPVKLDIAHQGAVRVSHAYGWREAAGIACIYVDLNSKRAEIAQTGWSLGEPPSVWVGANEDTLYVDEKVPRDELTEIQFPDYAGWSVFATDGPARYTLGVVLIRGEEQHTTAMADALYGSRCQAATIMRSHPKDDPTDKGKWRPCERPMGHRGRHRTHYCGRVRYWSDEATAMCEEEKKP